MTEERFTLLEDTNGGLDTVLETMVKDNGRFLTHKECCDLLNDLQQEAKDNEHYHLEVLRLYKAVSEENEQLKEENKELKKHIQELSDYIEELGGWGE